MTHGLRYVLQKLKSANTYFILHEPCDKPFPFKSKLGQEKGTEERAEGPFMVWSSKLVKHWVRQRSHNRTDSDVATKTTPNPTVN